MPKLRDLHDSAKDTAARLKEKAGDFLDKAQDKIEKFMDKAEDKVNCATDGNTYKMMARFADTTCNKATVSKFFEFKEKVKTLSPEENSLRFKEPTADDCSYFKKEATYYRDVKLPECGITKPIVSHFTTSDCYKNLPIYQQIVGLKGQCDKPHVEVLIADLWKLGMTAPDLILFQQDLDDSSYNLSARDCAWFNDQVDMYSAKLAECLHSHHYAVEL